MMVCIGCVCNWCILISTSTVLAYNYSTSHSYSVNCQVFLLQTPATHHFCPMQWHYIDVIMQVLATFTFNLCLVLTPSGIVLTLCSWHQLSISLNRCVCLCQCPPVLPVHPSESCCWPGGWPWRCWGHVGVHRGNAAILIDGCSSAGHVDLLLGHFHMWRWSGN